MAPTYGVPGLLLIRLFERKVHIRATMLNDVSRNWLEFLVCSV